VFIKYNGRWSPELDTMSETAVVLLWYSLAGMAEGRLFSGKTSMKWGVATF